ncbi:PAS domain-containing protein [Kordiimonas sp. SCSIO 12610]|uniref:PAS domain-containing protein n=1 Tax=Kordiimonas sp. SCSIO 12610 TaxID=2829597 RepID=UPI00210CC37E|nr:PAS domain-containing protein [Kordiimonas sp. SCSIO 12610]UTW56144.1 PAS domain-containing protein [Kordiimonas sp. SCSIO 12610]
MQRALSILSVEDIDERHPVRRFNAFWHDNLDDQGVFKRSFFKPATCHAILPWIVILEHHASDTEPEFLYRLCGTGFTELAGREFTGQYLENVVDPKAAKSMKQELLDCLKSRTPQYSQTELPVEGRDFIKVQRGVFPVSTDGSVIDQFFVVIAQHDCRIAEI